MHSADLDFLNPPPSPTILVEPASPVTNAVLPPPPGWEDPETPPEPFTGPPPDLDTLSGGNDNFLSHLNLAIESDVLHANSEVNGMSDGMALTSYGHDQTLDLFCRETFSDLSPKDDPLHLAPSTQNVKKQVKIHRVTLQKTAGGVQFLVDPPLPNTSSSQQVIPLPPSSSVSNFAPIPIPHPINAKEAQVVELKTTDLDTPVNTYENDKGEKVF